MGCTVLAGYTVLVGYIVSAGCTDLAVCIEVEGVTSILGCPLVEHSIPVVGSNARPGADMVARIGYAGWERTFVLPPLGSCLFFVPV